MSKAFSFLRARVNAPKHPPRGQPSERPGLSIGNIKNLAKVATLCSALASSAGAAYATTRNVWIESPVDTSEAARRLYRCGSGTECFTATSSFPSGAAWTWYGATLEGSASDFPSCACKNLTAPAGPVNVTAVYNGEACYAAIVTAVQFDWSMVATSPTNRHRNTLGVGEEVDLTVFPSSVTPVAWSVWPTSGAGSLNPMSGVAVQFTAGDSRSEPTIYAVVGGVDSLQSECWQAFSVIPPSGVIIAQDSDTGVWHEFETASVGFIGRPYYQPDTVSFYRIEAKEGEALGVGTGYFSTQMDELHGAGAWVAASSEVVAGKGTKGSGTDRIQDGPLTQTPYTDGEFLWPIPWFYRVGTMGAAHYFTTVDHLERIDPYATLSISKGGTTVTRAWNDPSSDY